MRIGARVEDGHFSQTEETEGKGECMHCERQRVESTPIDFLSLYLATIDNRF